MVLEPCKYPVMKILILSTSVHIISSSTSIFSKQVNSYYSVGHNHYQYLSILFAQKRGPKLLQCKRGRCILCAAIWMKPNFSLLLYIILSGTLYCSITWLASLLQVLQLSSVIMCFITLHEEWESSLNSVVKHQAEWRKFTAEINHQAKLSVQIFLEF
jgi:hypothetical protein